MKHKRHTEAQILGFLKEAESCNPSYRHTEHRVVKRISPYSRSPNFLRLCVNQICKSATLQT